MAPYPAALEGAKQIGFTVLSISLSLIAAFTPLIFMDGIVGRLLREFSLTLTFAIVVSTVVSLTVTPMICAHYIKEATSDRATWFDRLVEGTLSRIVSFYTWTLRAVLGFPFLTLLVFFATIALTVVLYIKTPKGYFPTDDSGFVIGATRASPDTSFQAMLGLQQQLADIVMADPAVAGVGSSLGGTAGPGGGGSNRGTMFISLKPPEERAGLSTAQVIDRLRRNLYRVAGIRLFMFAAQDIRTGGRQSDSDYQYTLSSTDLDLLQKWAPLVAKRMETVEGITDISSDRDPGGLQLSLVIDRKTASSLGVRVQDIDNALNNAFAQRQISIIYTQRNQYMVVLEIDPKFQSRSVQPGAHLRGRRQRRPGAAIGRGALPARPVGACGVSLAIVSLDDGLVQSAARRAAGGRDHEHPARGRGTAYAGRHPRQFRRQCRRFQQDQRTAAAADPGRAGGDVYRARRAL